MKKFYFKTVISIFLGLVLSFVLVGVFIVPNDDTLPRQILKIHMGSGLRFIYETIRTKSTNGARNWLKQNQKGHSRILSVRTLSPKEHQDLVHQNTKKGSFGTLFQITRERLSFYLPLKQKYAFLQFGPIRRPQPPPSILLTHLSILMVIIFIFTALLLMPMVRNLRRLEQGTRDLGRGNWDAQVDIVSNDSFGALGKSFNHMATQIHRLFQDREELLQAVSHELGTPLSRMRFSIELLESAQEQVVRQRHIQSLDEDLDELEQLSIELVNWLEADAPNQEHLMQDVQPILEQLIEQITEDTHGNLEIVFESHSRLFSQVNLRQFQRAIENLLRNATRHANKLVILDARQVENGIQIEIRDDGTGIPEEQREQIFDPFVSFSTKQEGVRSGVGLGLSIVQRILRRHQGSITLQKAPEGGASFETFWPLENV